MAGVMKRFFLVMCCVVGFAAQAAPAGKAQPVILVLGDSLSAGYGISAEQGWVSLLARRLKDQGQPHRVVNASISGDTTAGGLSRLPSAMDRHQPALVLIELGANDGLRGQPVAQMKTNLQKLIAITRSKGAKPVIFEMRIPSNYGPAYTAQFTAAFAAVAKAEKVLGKSRAGAIADLIVKPQGRPVIVREDDKRAPLGVEAGDFDEFR